MTRKPQERRRATRPAKTPPSPRPTPLPKPPSPLKGHFLGFQDLLRSRGWSQRSLAGELEVDPTFLSHIAHGRKEPSLSLARRIAAALKISIDTLTHSIERR